MIIIVLYGNTRSDNDVMLTGALSLSWPAVPVSVAAAPSVGADSSLTAPPLSGGQRSFVHSPLAVLPGRGQRDRHSDQLTLLTHPLPPNTTSGD